MWQWWNKWVSKTQAFTQQLPHWDCITCCSLLTQFQDLALRIDTRLVWKTLCKRSVGNKEYVFTYTCQIGTYIHRAIIKKHNTNHLIAIINHISYDGWNEGLVTALCLYYWKWRIVWCLIGMSIWFAHHVHSLTGQFAKPVNIEICSIKYSGLLFHNISI